MTKGLNEEFYKHLHALDDRYGYALERHTGDRCWVWDASDDDPDLIFCQNYVKERFPQSYMEEVDEDFEDVFYDMVTTGPTSVNKIASVLGCTSTMVRKLTKKHGFERLYSIYQGFFHATVIHNHRTHETIAATTMKDVMRYCGYKMSNRPNVSRAKSTGIVMDGFSFESMEDYLKFNEVDKSKVEELYEQKVTRIA